MPSAATAGQAIRRQENALIMHPVILLIIGGYFLCNAWIIRWTWQAWRGNRIARMVICLLLALWASLFPLLYRSGGNSLPEIWLLRAGAVWLGMFFYLFILTLADDLFFRIKYRGRTKERPVRRRPRYAAFGMIYGAVALLTAAGWLNAAFSKITEIELMIPTERQAFPDLTDNTMTIAVLSDLHLGRIIGAARLARALKLLEPHQPDAIFLLGDLIDDHSGLNPAEIRRTVAAARPRFGLWGILGNHEYLAGDRGREILEECGVEVLRDEWTVLGNSLLVVGRDDYSASRFGAGDRKTLPEILRQIPDEYLKLPLAVLDHQPRRLAEAEQVNAALQLSGHTHNGQLWPFNLLTASAYENGRGHSRRNHTHYLVTIGAGTWGPPIRNNARPEVLLIRLRFVPAGDQSSFGKLSVPVTPQL